MKFRFKIQQYQTDAVNAIVDVFKGQPYLSQVQFTVDENIFSESQSYWIDNSGTISDEAENGFSNAKIVLSPEEILTNIKEIQAKFNIKESSSLSHKFGAVDLDVEMETGTGKTYVYIKSMFELNKRYGFSKFIVVVPSVAIREGVKKSFEMTQDHFMDSYGKKARYFIYNSKKPGEIKQFASSASINVMIINYQAFITDSNKIKHEIDDFQSRRPIDIIAQNHPILILDEPQKLGGNATQQALHDFKPLFSMNFSATHKETHNPVYVLDALDAYNKKLVKKIQVKGFTIKNLQGTNGYLYLQNIIISPDKPPMARIEMEIKKNAGIKRDIRLCKVGSNLYQMSNELSQYKGYIINEINPYNNTVTFVNGEVIEIGAACGDVSENDIRRAQIRETILSHFDKEAEMFDRGIKVLSLFFIDEVAKYRQYNENGDEINGLYGTIFEEEYTKILNDYITLLETPYIRFLKSTSACTAHKGYFSIDKKGHKIDSVDKKGRKMEESEDVTAYDLILKDKERLLSFDEPTRFIFSHSALREGWDNPNVFQICTLKHSSNNIQRRQEVGRGLRLCVNRIGERMDSTIPNFDVHSLNVLTVVTNDSYENFVKDLQAEIKETLYDRPKCVSKEFFIGKRIMLNEKEHIITKQEALTIYRYLVVNDYVDGEDKPNDNYKKATINKTLEPLNLEPQSMVDIIHTLIRSTYDTDALKEMVTNGRQAEIMENKLNKNFEKEEFKKLWNEINHKYAYTVDFNSDELIKNSIAKIDESLTVSIPMYTVSTGEQKAQINAEEIDNGVSFGTVKTKNKKLKSSTSNMISYDLIGQICKKTNLTRRTIAAILKGISPAKFAYYAVNPEEFFSNISKIINEQKATIIIDHITYNQIDGSFDSEIFTESKKSGEFQNAFMAKKHIRDYVFVDGINKDKSVEKQFVEKLDSADEVCVYAKLPKGFYIPTPMGHYSPDWAIAFYEGTVKHIYFIAETKGSLDSFDLKGIEKVKTNCAKVLFNSRSNSRVRYDVVKTFDDLMNKVLTC